MEDINTEVLLVIIGAVVILCVKHRHSTEVLFRKIGHNFPFSVVVQPRIGCFLPCLLYIHLWFKANCCLVHENVHFCLARSGVGRLHCSFVCFTGCLSPTPANHRVRPFKWNQVHWVQNCDIAVLISYISRWHGMFGCNCTSSTSYIFHAS